MKLKKSVAYLLIFIMLITTLGFIVAQESDESASYACLEKSLGDNCGDSKSTKQDAFNLLAIAYKSNLQSDCKSALKKKLQSNCWADTETGSCNIKSTAIATISLDYVGENVENYIKWLLTKRISNTELTWYLEIDSNNKTECDINGKKVIINEDKRISGSLPSGLEKAYGGYWFEIKDIKRNYTITCNKDFITALLYTKPGSNVYHVLSETKTASEYGSITEKVESYCFSTSPKCDYEGTLWTTIALAKSNEDISSYLPYLTAMYDKSENKKYFPSAFLYMLTDSDDYYDEIINLQKSNYWDESGNKFYDTSVALMALGEDASTEADTSRRYLLSIRKNDGCWQSDTGFILHAGWPKKPVSSGGDGSGTSLNYCESFDYYCTSFGECLQSNRLDNFICENSLNVCCEVNAVEPTCTDKGGVLCEFDEECEGETVSSADYGTCCIGDCIVVDTTPECEDQGHLCKTQCEDTEEERTGLSTSCDFNEVCCAKKTSSESKTNWWLIILLIILIILVILAIIFRNQLKVFFLKRKSLKEKPRSSPPMANLRPPIFAAPPMRQTPIRRPVSRANPAKDREFEETMKKLRDMSK